MIRVGIGGWTYAPWRGTFYPDGLPAKRELEHASRHLTAIEINGTFYRSQGPKSFAKWREETPDNFVFTVKGHRAVVNAKELAEAGEAVEWFFKSGVTELGPKLGPILWQFAPFKKFDAERSRRHFSRCSRERSRACRSAMPSRCGTKSFVVPEFVELARKHNVAIVYADSDEHPAIADVTADFVYARLQRSSADEETGYAAATSINGRSARRSWAAGGAPEDLTVCRRRQRRRRRSATCSCFSSAARRNAIPPRRRR